MHQLLQALGLSAASFFAQDAFLFWLNAEAGGAQLNQAMTPSPDQQGGCMDTYPEHSRAKSQRQRRRQNGVGVRRWPKAARQRPSISTGSGDAIGETSLAAAAASMVASLAITVRRFSAAATITGAGRGRGWWLRGSVTIQLGTREAGGDRVRECSHRRRLGGDAGRNELDQPKDGVAADGGGVPGAPI